MNDNKPAADKPLIYEDFADKVGEVFAVSEDGLPAIPLTLQKAQLLNPDWGLKGARPPFELAFLAKNPGVLPQRLYSLNHERLGLVTIFLVPSAKNADGVSYHATFN
jgi:hypothetical protein